MQDRSFPLVTDKWPQEAHRGVAATRSRTGVTPDWQLTSSICNGLLPLNAFPQERCPPSFFVFLVAILLFVLSATKNPARLRRNQIKNMRDGRQLKREPIERQSVREWGKFGTVLLLIASRNWLFQTKTLFSPRDRATDTTPKCQRGFP